MDQYSDTIFDHHAISVNDLDGTSDWYQRALGMKFEGKFVVRGTNLSVVTLLHKSGYRIELLHRPDSIQGPGSTGFYDAAGTRGYSHICLRTNNVSATFEELRRAGATVHQEPRPSSQRVAATVAFVSDPEGNLIEIFDRPEMSDEPTSSQVQYLPTRL